MALDSFMQMVNKYLTGEESPEEKKLKLNLLIKYFYDQVIRPAKDAAQLLLQAAEFTPHPRFRLATYTDEDAQLDEEEAKKELDARLALARSVLLQPTKPHELMKIWQDAFKGYLDDTLDRSPAQHIMVARNNLFAAANIRPDRNDQLMLAETDRIIDTHFINAVQQNDPTLLNPAEIHVQQRMDTHVQGKIPGFGADVHNWAETFIPEQTRRNHHPATTRAVALKMAPTLALLRPLYFREGETHEVHPHKQPLPVELHGHITSMVDHHLNYFHSLSELALMTQLVTSHAIRHLKDAHPSFVPHFHAPHASTSILAVFSQMALDTVHEALDYAHMGPRKVSTNPFAPIMTPKGPFGHQ